MKMRKRRTEVPDEISAQTRIKVRLNGKGQAAETS